MSRRVAREIGVQMLYQLDFQDEDVKQQIDIFINGIKEDRLHNDEPLEDLTDADVEYIKEVVDGTFSNLNIIDQKISSLAKDWPLDRIAKVDLAILRLAIYEILYKSDIPTEVSINEAVEVSKKYSTNDSKTFINGILAKVVE